MTFLVDERILRDEKPGISALVNHKYHLAATREFLAFTLPLPFPCSQISWDFYLFLSTRQRH